MSKDCIRHHGQHIESYLYGCPTCGAPVCCKKCCEEVNAHWNVSELKKQVDCGAVVGETWTGTDEQIDRNIRANSGVDWKDSNTVSEEENMIYLPPLDISAPVPEGMKEAVRFFEAPDLKEKRIEMILSDAFGAPFDDTDQRMADAKWGALACIRIDRERIWNNLYAQPYNDTPVGAERARKVIFEEEE